MLPFFLCSATAGQIADESDKARLIRLIKLLEIPVMLAAAGGVLAGSPTVLLALLFMMGIQAAFFGPLKYAILPDILRPGELLLGNALVEAGTFIAILLGTIAGMLIATQHGAAAVAGLIIAVALAAWAASWGIPHTSARRRGTAAARWRLIATTARVIRQAAQRTRAVPRDARDLVVLAGGRGLPVAVPGLCPLHPRRGRGGRDLVPDVVFDRHRVRLAALQPAPRGASSARGSCPGGRSGSASSRSISGSPARRRRAP